MSRPRSPLPLRPRPAQLTTARAAMAPLCLPHTESTRPLPRTERCARGRPSPPADRFAPLPLRGRRTRGRSVRPPRGAGGLQGGDESRGLQPGADAPDPAGSCAQLLCLPLRGVPKHALHRPPLTRLRPSSRLRDGGGDRGTGGQGAAARSEWGYERGRVRRERGAGGEHGRWASHAATPIDATPTIAPFTAPRSARSSLHAACVLAFRLGLPQVLLQMD